MLLVRHALSNPAHLPLQSRFPASAFEFPWGLGVANTPTILPHHVQNFVSDIFSSTFLCDDE